ncbi:hypothetical protein SCA6_011241 [Theobroma cacao]
MDDNQLSDHGLPGSLRILATYSSQQPEVSCMAEKELSEQTVWGLFETLFSCRSVISMRQTYTVN